MSPPRIVKHLAAALPLALALLAPVAGRAACRIESVELPVTMSGTRAIATVGINGKQVKFIVDSGAFYSMLTESAAKELGLQTRNAPPGSSLRVEGMTGDIDTNVTRVKSLKLLKGEIPNVDFLVGGSEPGQGAIGLLGRNLLDAVDTEYDLANGMIRFMNPQGCGDANLAYWAGSAPVSMVPLDYTRSGKLAAIEVPVKINGKEVRALFDTGAQTVVTLKAAQRAGIEPGAMKSIGRTRGGGQGDAPAWLAPFATFEIGGERVSNNRFEVADFKFEDIDMLVGIDFFLSHRIFVAHSQQRLYFTYNGGPVFALNALPAASAGAASDAASAADTSASLDAAGYARRGAASLSRGDYASALADLDRACELDPKSAAYLTLRGKVRAVRGEPKLALEDYDAAVRLDAGNSEARLQRAGARAWLGDRDGANADLDELDHSLTPESPLRLDLSKVYLRVGNRAALAQADIWLDAHRLDPSIDRGMHERCWASAMLDVELDRSLPLCNDAVRLRPSEANYLDSRAWLQVRRAAYREAVTDFDAALKLNPKQAWSLYGRGIARLGSGGDAAQGRADIAAARQLLPSIDKDAARYGITVPN